MNPNDAKNILLLYRPGTEDEGDPQIAEALSLAKQDMDLARWLEGHCARQTAIRERFRRIAAPDGLKQQILSEQAARSKVIFWRPRLILAAVAAVVVLLAVTGLWLRPGIHDDTFAIYRSRMAGIALRGYAMDLQTTDANKIREYLAQHGAPADYALPKPLRDLSMSGCAIESWQGVKVSMICFRTGKPLPSGEQSDLWLFVVEQGAVKHAPNGTTAQIAAVNRLSTATWVQNEKLYLLGTVGDKRAIQRFL